MEENVWFKDQRRPVRQPVIFRLTSIGKIQGVRLDQYFTSDFGLFYDPDDVMLIDLLQRERPEIDWGALVFWRQYERGQIDIIDPTADRTVGSIVVRRRLGGDPSGETDWTNVVQPIRFRQVEMEGEQG